MQHVFIIGAKGIGNYGGYETFLQKLVKYHKDNDRIRYHIACKANGQGAMDETKLPGAKTDDASHFTYFNAECFKINIPEKLGPAQAIYYDIAALRECIKLIKEQGIQNPIIYILACRVGPFVGHYVKQVHKLGGQVFLNPDGHEWKRAKWSAPVRRYWKVSEAGMVKHADLVVCDSINIEKYIQTEYAKYHPKTTFIAYGSDIYPSKLADDDEKFTSWLSDKGVSRFNYYLVVGRFVPENNFETMIREFMKSNSKKDFAIITTQDRDFLAELDNKLHFKNDRRIKFVGTVYDQELLKKIRENAYGYFHGHSVGGTNPSLLEALGSTKLNLLLNVVFNEEVGQDAAIYWSKEEGNLAGIIDQSDKMEQSEIDDYGRKAKQRIKDAYSWQFIADRYDSIFG
ncbi:DUF1972 domain-containing protein [Limosilactobacillus fermentum]|uniref:beta 1-4 rhamnosyltransferase Cps2T n=1 Tax=Limosilactobacillus fermentum TaxID=1613 RepID=UPI0018801D02|nr:DUF1972 domain-containing protein [Limosilactobacillus fermentum]MBE8118839.1 DUF1972 domain-containing protein [Limosilactobacillus fermentum]